MEDAASSTAATVAADLGLPVGPERSRPVAGTAGRYYHATDSGIIWYDDGTRWRATPDLAPDTLTLTGWSGGAYLTSDAAATQTAAPPCTILVAFYLATLPAGAQRLVLTFSDPGGARGMQIAFCNPTANRIGWIGYGLSVQAEIPADLALGWHVAAFAISASGADTVVEYGLDGTAYGPDTLTGTYAAPTSADTFRVGNGSGGPVPMLSDTGLGALVFLDGALTAVELAAITATPTDGRIVTPAGYVETFSLRASRLGGAPRIAGALVWSGGTEPRTLTTTGTLTPVAR